MSFHELSRRWLCITGVITVAAAVMAAGASADTMSGAAVPRAGTANISSSGAGTILGGFTSQGWTVVVDFGKNGKRIRLIAIGLDMKCTSGDQFSTEDGFANVAIAPSGRVHATSKIPSSPGPTESLTGGSDSLTGRFNRKRSAFQGTWELHLSFQSSTGQTDECDSGRVSFAANL